MKNELKKWLIAGIIFTILFGTLLHFVYEWSGENSFVGIFGAVNESTWEHLKLLFWPAFFFAIVEYLFIGFRYNNFIFAKAVSLYVGIFLIISLFYTYTGIIGDNYLVLDISIFVLSVIISQYIGYRIIVSDRQVSKLASGLALLSIVILAFAFVVFTFQTPMIPLFEDPLTGTYGI